MSDVESTDDNKDCIRKYPDYGIEEWTRNPLPALEWQYLPEIVLVNIYRYLRRKDRLHMALSCKHWLISFHSACLWRKYQLNLGLVTSREESKAIAFCQKHGSHIKYLTIQCRKYPSANGLCQRFVDTAKKCFEAMEFSSLLEFNMPRMDMERYWSADYTKHMILTILCKFFEGQKRLRKCNLFFCQLNVGDGCKLLKALGLSSGSALTCLYLKDFFSGQGAYKTRQWKEALSVLVNESLHCLYLNYHCLSNEVMDILAMRCSSNMKLLSVRAYKHESYTHTISTQSWKALHDTCSKLKVDFDFEGMALYEDVLPILNPALPLHNIYIWSGYHATVSRAWGINLTLDYLSQNYKHTLSAIILELDNARDFIGISLLNLARACTKLSCIDINGCVDITTVDLICQAQKQKKIFLKKFCVTAGEITQVAAKEFENLFAVKYRDMIIEQGLTFVFSTEHQADAVPDSDP